MSVSRRSAVVVKAQKSEGVQNAVAAAALAAIVGFSGVAPAYADISGEEQQRVSPSHLRLRRKLFLDFWRSPLSTSFAQASPLAARARSSPKSRSRSVGTEGRGFPLDPC